MGRGCAISVLIFPKEWEIFPTSAWNANPGEAGEQHSGQRASGDRAIRTARAGKGERDIRRRDQPPSSCSLLRECQEPTVEARHRAEHRKRSDAAEPALGPSA